MFKYCSLPYGMTTKGNEIEKRSKHTLNKFNALCGLMIEKQSLEIFKNG